MSRRKRGTMPWGIGACLAGALLGSSLLPCAHAADPTPSKPGKTDPVVVDARTEDVIRAALRYLAAKQTPNGSWCSPNGEHPLAVTSYAIMAFMACGNVPNEGEYGRAVQSGLGFILSCCRDDGYITSEDIAGGRKPSNMYDHGIATIVLGEIYGQTRDPKVKARLQAAVGLIVRAQNREGGWRYKPRPETADVSVTVLQVVALRAAKNSGLAVPQTTVDQAVQYVKSCYDPPTSGFTYQPNNHQPGFARTAAAIYSLQVCGLYDDPLVAKGSQFLIHGQGNEGQWFTYGHFYAAPAQYMIGGDVWRDWYARVKAVLLGRVVQQPGDKTIAYWETIDADTRAVGSVYATAVYTSILAMPYHYVPLYQR